MLHTPSHDLTAFLGERSDQWRTESFTERTFEGLLKSAPQFSCVVIGFDAIVRSPQYGRRLRMKAFPPAWSSLHQGDAEAFAILNGKRGLPGLPSTFAKFLRNPGGRPEQERTPEASSR